MCSVMGEIAVNSVAIVITVKLRMTTMGRCKASEVEINVGEVPVHYPITHHGASSSSPASYGC